jgi:hypothetical protein
MRNEQENEMTQDIRDDVHNIDVQPAVVGIDEQVAAWLQANVMRYSESPEGRWFSLRITGEYAGFQMTIDAAGESQDARLLFWPGTRSVFLRRGAPRWPTSSHASTAPSGSAGWYSIWAKVRSACALCFLFTTAS